MIMLSQHFSPFAERTEEREMTHLFICGGKSDRSARLYDFTDGVLALTRKTSHGGNPWASVLVSWIFAQVGRLEFTINRAASSLFFLTIS